jgi:hypothetical protein
MQGFYGNNYSNFFISLGSNCIIVSICVWMSMIQPVGAAVGILDQIRPGGTLHVQHGAEKESDRDLHQVRP